MKALIGFTDIKFLQEHMILDNLVYNNVPYGLSSVIHEQDDYIVGSSRDVYLDNDHNFFNLLTNTEDSSLTAAEIKAKMRSLESFSFHIDNGGVENLYYFSHFMDNAAQQPNWYFVMQVSGTYLRESRATFVVLSLALLGVVVIVLLILMLYGIFTSNKPHTAAQAVHVRSGFLSP